MESLHQLKFPILVSSIDRFHQKDSNEKIVPTESYQEDLAPPLNSILTSLGDDNDSQTSSVPDGFRRIRMLQDLPEPILRPDDKPVDLSIGDVHVCPNLLADALIGGGMAEPADL